MAFSSLANALGAPQHQQLHAPSLPQSSSVIDHASPMNFVNPSMAGRYDNTHATIIAHVQDLQDQSYQYHLQPSPLPHPVLPAEPRYQAAIPTIAVPTPSMHPPYANAILDPSAYHPHQYMMGQSDPAGDTFRGPLPGQAICHPPNVTLPGLSAAYLLNLKLRLRDRERAKLETPLGTALSAVRGSESFFDNGCVVETQPQWTAVSNNIQTPALHHNRTFASAKAPRNEQRVSPYLAAYHREKERRDAQMQRATEVPHRQHQRIRNAPESVAPLNYRFGPGGDAGQVSSSSFTAIELPYDTRNTCIGLDQSTAWPNGQTLAMAPSMTVANSIGQLSSSSHGQFSTWSPPAWSDGNSGLSCPSSSLWTETESSPPPGNNTISIPSFQLQELPLPPKHSTKKSQTSTAKPKQPKKPRVWGEGREYMRGYRAPPSEPAKEATRKALEDRKVKKTKTAVKKVVKKAAAHARKIRSMRAKIPRTRVKSA